MTANQIAAASEREGERHNFVSEEETKRHNLRIEDIDAEKNYIQSQYNMQRLELEAELNRNRLEFDKAAEENRVALESERNRITYELGVAEQNYRLQMAEFERNRVSTEKEYKEAMIRQGEYSLALQEKKNYYENQKTEAQTNQILEQITLSKRKFTQDQMRIDQEFELGLINAEQRDKEIKIAQDKYDFEASKWNDVLKQQEEQRTYLFGVQAATAVTNSAANMVDSILPF